MLVLSFLFCLLLCCYSTTSAYTCDNPCFGNMCCSIPDDGLYYLTDFCDQQTACNIPCSSLTWFAADSQRFGCRKTLSICREGSTTCVNTEVIDAGPNIAVERESGRPIIDASSSVCKALFGVSSCGWSDHFGISALVSVTAAKYPMGPFNVTESEMQQMILEHNAMHNVVH